MVTLSDMRAPIFVPADRPGRFAKAAASGADAIILDLEDAVPPANKAVARAALATNFTPLPVVVRINAMGTPWHDDDVLALRDLGCAAIMLPKAEDARYASGLAAKAGIPVLPLIETARGLAAARSIAQADGIARLAFGSVDYCDDLGMAHLREVLLPARSELVLASRLAGIAAPLDGVTLELSKDEIAESDARHAGTLGMTGKLCIHPRQIAPVMRGFAPDAAQIAWARRILASGDGAVAIDGVMVDAPVRRRAQSILNAAEKNIAV